MVMKTLIFLLLFFVIIAKGHIEFEHIDACSSSNVTMSFEECEIVNNRVNVALLFWRPVTKIFVRWKLKNDVTCI
jgi:hypothetical protein